MPGLRFMTQAERLFHELKSARPFFLIAGPCVVESRSVMMEIGQSLQDIQVKLGIPVIFKASFDKANRQSINSYRGPGMQAGLKLLEELKAETGLPVLTDVHETYQVKEAAEVADVLQIPALLCRQTDLIVEAAKTGRIINIKKGQFLAAEAMADASHKAQQTGNKCILLTERGTSFGYGDLVCDVRNLVKLRGQGGLVVQDVTHSVQRPGGKGNSSGGNREFIPVIARAAAAVGVDGFFFETHPDPERARSDGPNSIPLHSLRTLLEELSDIAMASKGRSETQT